MIVCYEPLITTQARWTLQNILGILQGQKSVVAGPSFSNCVGDFGDDMPPDAGLHPADAHRSR